MNTAISLALDILTVILLAVPVIWGIARGMKRCGFSLLSLVVSSAVAFAVSGILAKPMYESFFKQNVHELCYNAAVGYDPVDKAGDLLESYGISVPEEDIREALTSSESLPVSMGNIARQCGADEENVYAIEQDIQNLLNEDVPDEIKKMIPRQLGDVADIELTDGELYDAARACAQSPEEAADYIEQTYAAPAVTALIKTVLFFITLVIVSLIMRLAYFLFRIEFGNSPKTFGDRFGGAVLGILMGMANLAVLAIAVSSAEQASDGLFNIELLDSRIFLPFFKIMY